MLPISQIAGLLFVLAMLLFPTKDPHILQNELAIANAIATVTDDPIEQATLMRIARFESGFSSEVARCDRLGPQKERGTYQVKPQARGDDKKSCGTQVEQATLALSYLRRGADYCHRKLTDGPKALYPYVSGLCAIDGQAAKMAERRWGGTPLQELRAANDNDVPLTSKRVVVKKAPAAATPTEVVDFTGDTPILKSQAL